MEREWCYNQPMIWANFLHIYQPPTQRSSILKRVVDESYNRVLEGIKNNPSARITLNINGCLLDLLKKNGYQYTIDLMHQLLLTGQLEMTLSAMYHPLLPMLPDKEVIRQIELDFDAHKKYFGEDFIVSGFFPPESAYTPHLAKIIRKLGFSWVIAEELSYNGQFGAVKGDSLYEVANIEAGGSDNKSATNPFLGNNRPLGLPEKGKINIFFREREASFKILSGQLGTAKLFERYLENRLNKDEYLVTAMDGETFGHHRPGMEKLLFEIYRSELVKTCRISDLLQLFSKVEKVATVPSTWALMEKDLEKNAPFSRWDDKDNVIHKKQWELTRLAIKVVEKETVPNTHSRDILDRALHSDQYWWASARPWWSLEMIEAGAKELKDTVMSSNASSAMEKERALDLYLEIITTGFDWQRSGEVEARSRKEDEEVRERTDRNLPKLPAEEVNKMIKNIEDEMLSVASNKEYERAAQLRDRIIELRSYISS